MADVDYLFYIYKNGKVTDDFFVLFSMENILSHAEKHCLHSTSKTWKIILLIACELAVLMQISTLASVNKIPLTNVSQ